VQHDPALTQLERQTVRLAVRADAGANRSSFFAITPIFAAPSASTGPEPVGGGLARHLPITRIGGRRLCHC